MLNDFGSSEPAVVLSSIGQNETTEQPNRNVTMHWEQEKESTRLFIAKCSKRIL